MAILKEVAFKAREILSKKTLADVLEHSSAPSLKQLRHGLGMGEGQQNTWGCGLACLRALTSLLNKCWEGNEASQALCPSGCIIRRKVRLPHLEKLSLSGENVAMVFKGGPDWPEDLSAGVIYTLQQNLTAVHDGF